jgi:Tol biopolymer transport system component/DNA-binding winged helix-turn-helix (wHTH) protein
MSPPQPAPQRIVRFGPFALDLESGELLKEGVRIKLQDQPFQILCILLEKPGRVVAREELKNRVWPADTFVEFDQGVYSAVRRLRDALCDSAETPRYIETLPRRGYRFIASVDEPPPQPEPGFADSAEQIRWRIQLEQSSADRSQVSDPVRSATSDGGSRTKFSQWRTVVWLSTALLIVAGIVTWQLLRRNEKAASKRVTLHRLTDFVGLEEFPAISPDGKTVAFTSDTEKHRQIWVRLIAGGTPLQITHDEVDHLYPRWSQDATDITYYSPPRPGEEQGTLWEVSALGGTPRRLTPSLGGADASHDGQRLAFFRLNEKQHIELVVSSRDTSESRVTAELPPLYEYNFPRWSPDDRWIAYQRASLLWNDEIFLVPSAGGNPRQITHEGVLLSGLCWLPDGSGVAYSSARGSTIFYLPIMHLWATDLKGSEPRQLSYGETSLQSPDVDPAGTMVASRLRVEFDIWKYPTMESATSTVRDATRITRQTGQVQTPTASPGDRELAYLSDEGGHGNVRVLDLHSGGTRQITSERDPRVAVGVPVWSPDGSSIAFVSFASDWDTGEIWLVNPDGSNLRRLAKAAGWATWSDDSRWVYYTLQGKGGFQILKIGTAGGTAALVRTDNAWSSALAADGSALYYVVPLLNVNGTADFEIRVARPENGVARLLARIAGTRVPHWQTLQGVLSHDGEWLALPLNDGTQTNLWLVATSKGRLRQVTDFGPRRTFIARRVSWSSDDRYLYAAVGDGDADIIELEGVLP